MFVYIFIFTVIQYFGICKIQSVKVFNHKTVLSVKVLCRVMTLIDLIICYQHNIVDFLCQMWKEKAQLLRRMCVLIEHYISCIIIRSVKMLEHLVFDSVIFVLVLQTTINIDFDIDRFYLKKKHMIC